MKRIPGSSFTVLPVILTTLAVVAMANVLTLFPTSVDTGVPAYARIELAADGLTPLVHHDKDWAAIYFYRDPACVPVTFNLLDFADIPAVFGCNPGPDGVGLMTVEGFTIWKNGPPPMDDAPLQTVSYGKGAVPFWFVRWDLLRAALGDKWLTMPELSALSPLKGTASSFKETLHPYGPGGGSGAKRTMLQVVARGFLEDGRTFDFQSEENFQTETRDIESNTVTTIRFK